MTLKEVDSDVESRVPQRRKYRGNYKNYRRRRPDRENRVSENQTEDDKENQTRPAPRKKSNKRSKEARADQDSEKIVSRYCEC